MVWGVWFRVDHVRSQELGGRVYGVWFWADHLLPWEFNILGVVLHGVVLQDQGPRFIVSGMRGKGGESVVQKGGGAHDTVNPKPYTPCHKS